MLTQVRFRFFPLKGFSYSLSRKNTKRKETATNEQKCKESDRNHFELLLLKFSHWANFSSARQKWPESLAGDNAPSPASTLGVTFIPLPSRVHDSLCFPLANPLGCQTGCKSLALCSQGHPECVHLECILLWKSDCFCQHIFKMNRWICVCQYFIHQGRKQEILPQN